MTRRNLGSLYRLGVVYERGGERERAKEAFRRFVEEWEGEPSYREAAEKRLGELEGKVP